MRQAWAATDNNLFSLFWKYNALSFLLKKTVEEGEYRRSFWKFGIIPIMKAISTCASSGKWMFLDALRTLMEVPGGFAEL